MNIPSGSDVRSTYVDNLTLFEPISVTQDHSKEHSKPVQYPVVLWHFQLCTGFPNNNLWSTEATRMDANGCDMLNSGNFVLFWTTGGFVSPHGNTNKNPKCCSYVDFREKMRLLDG